MKKLLLLSITLLTLNACKFVHLKEPYLETTEGKNLEVPEGQSTPNSSSTLDVPRSENKAEVNTVADMPDSTPPDMPIRMRQSDSGKLKIVHRLGFPVLTAKFEQQKVWDSMQALQLDGWSLQSKSADDCSVTLSFTDPAAEERKNAGFFKKLFTREEYYPDNSGDYKLQCKTVKNVIEVTFGATDGTPAKTYIADSVMNHLFDKLEK